MRRAKGMYKIVDAQKVQPEKYTLRDIDKVQSGTGGSVGERRDPGLSKVSELSTSKDVRHLGNKTRDKVTSNTIKEEITGSVRERRYPEVSRVTEPSTSKDVTHSERKAQDKVTSSTMKKEVKAVYQFKQARPLSEIKRKPGQLSRFVLQTSVKDERTEQLVENAILRKQFLEATEDVAQVNETIQMADSSTLGVVEVSEQSIHCDFPYFENIETQTEMEEVETGTGALSKDSNEIGVDTNDDYVDLIEQKYISNTPWIPQVEEKITNYQSKENSLEIKKLETLEANTNYDLNISESTPIFYQTKLPNELQSQVEEIFVKKYKGVKKDFAMQFPKMKKPKTVIDPKSIPCDVYTGMLSDGNRRADYVLVINATVSDAVKTVQTQFLVNLVKLGLVIEIENGVLVRNKHLQFVKLHAPDEVLNEYADTFRVRKMFRDNHTQYIHNYRGRFWYKSRCFLQEKECLLAVRENYIKPLKLSNLDRSYIIYLLLCCQPFGDPVNYCGLQRLLDSKILLDSYALHDGPYFCSEQKNRVIFNCREILYLHWAGLDNMFTYQPMSLVYEYFGSKLAFYFMFYEFYNKALVVASMWGLFMTLMYIIKDSDYMGKIRSRICSDSDVINNNATTLLDIQCAECVGVGRDRRCPVKKIKHQCFDMQLLKYFDNPYIILYSLGICLWATSFMVFWNRVEYYWRWLWEEGYTNMMAHKILRPEHESIHKYTDVSKMKCIDRLRYRSKLKITKFASRFSRFGVAHILLPLIGLVMLTFIVLFFIYGYVEWIRPLTVEDVSLNTSLVPVSWKNKFRVVPNIDRSKDFVQLAVSGFFLCGIMYMFEKLFHTLSYYVNVFENHVTHQDFEDYLILHYFSYSIIYGSAFLVYFAWLKGIFYVSPIEVDDMMIKFQSPWKHHLVNVTSVSVGLRNMTLRLMTWNCGGNLSCFREAVVIYLVTIVFRVLVLRVAEGFWLTFSDLLKRRGNLDDNLAVPTAEREYMLRPITEQSIVNDFNKLVVQFALVALFTPLFPLAPLIAFINNIFHLRTKAKACVISCRRVVMFRSKGIGYWNMMLKLICYGTPLFHAITLTQTEMFKKYVFYKQPRGEKDAEAYTKYITGFTTVINLARYSVSDKSGTELPYWDKAIDHLEPRQKGYEIVSKCYVDALLEQYFKPKNLASRWPFRWDYLEDNRTYSYYSTEHYYLKYLKVLFVIMFLHVFALVAAAVWSISGVRPSPVERVAARELRVRRYHLHRLRPPPARPALCIERVL